MNSRKRALVSLMMAVSFSSMAATYPSYDLDASVVTKISDKLLNYDMNQNRDNIVSSVNDAIAQAGSFDQLQSDADRGDGESCLSMYKVYKYGIARDRDATRALHYLERAADSNNPKAKLALGLYYMDYNKADSFSQTMVDETMDHYKDYYNTNWSTSTSVLRNQIGFHLVKDASYLGDAQAQYVLGYIYLDNSTDNVDKLLGHFWMSHSYSGGYSPAYNTLQMLGDERDNLGNIEKIRTQVSYGDPSAMTALAQYYLQGFIVEKDVQRAKKLLVTAAALGDAKAKAELAHLVK